jgi:hypothetical protein
VSTPAVELRRDHEELAVGDPGDQRLHAAQHVASIPGPGARLEREGIEERSRLEHSESGGGHVLADELRQVGGLLLGVPPQPDRGAHCGGGEGREGEAHVTVGHRLGDQDGGHGGALPHGAAQLLGNADRGDTELGALLEQLARRGAGVVSVMGCGPQPVLGEPANRVAHHLLLVGRRQVE